jgi:DNA-directed RNA polymerase subunit RPC12/RpoP
MCICPECGTEVPHGRGEPCNKIKCPSCGSYMTRK